VGAAVLVLSAAFSVWSADPIDVKIDRSADRFNLGISDFFPEDRSLDDGFLKSLKGTVVQDLAFSKLFNLIKDGPLVRKKNEAFAWGKIGSDVVLTAGVRRKSDGALEMSARLYDTKKGDEVLSLNKKAALADSRVMAHELANDIVAYFTSRPGIFTSRIAFVNDATGRKELYICDYDGKNARRYTNDNSIVILPRLSPDGKKLVFTSYMAGNPDLYLMNRDGTGRKRISAKAGLNVSPSWTPDSQQLAVTLSQNGPPNIYLIDLQGQVIRRMTDNAGADTAPSFSPDGSQLAFTSDRAGAPHIYIMNLDGTGLRRITTASHCDSAAWSPDGQTILYVKGEGKGKFDIYSIEVLTGVERRLTWGTGDSENPAWSPDSRFILFTSNRRGKSELFIMSADGSDQTPLFTNNGQSFTPHWSN
jgi:TolB protein